MGYFIRVGVGICTQELFFALNLIAYLIRTINLALSFCLFSLKPIKSCFICMAMGLALLAIQAFISVG